IAEVQKAAATIGTSSHGMTDRAEGSPRICRPASAMMATAAKYKAAMGNREECAAMEIVTIRASKIRRARRNSLEKTSRNAHRNKTPAKTSGIRSETSHGRLVSAAKTRTPISRQRSRNLLSSQIRYLKVSYKT